MVSPEVPFFKDYLKHLNNFGDQEYIFIIIKTDGTEENKKKAQDFAEGVARRLRTQDDLVRAIYYRLSAEDFGEKALLFASLEEAKKRDHRKLGKELRNRRRLPGLPFARQLRRKPFMLLQQRLKCR